VDRSYREHPPPPGLAGLVACTWTSHDGEVEVLPDGCADVVFDGGRLVVAGPATTVKLAPATPGLPRCGVRFRTGAAFAALGAPADGLRDLGPELTELWGRAARRLEDRVSAAPTIEAAAQALLEGVAARLPADSDPLVHAVLKGVRPLYVQARELGISERQLRRRFERAVGYGPATLRRIRRFQRFLALAQAAPPQATLAWLAADAGYADQAHLARETRRLAGRTPSALLAAGATPTGDPAPVAGLAA